MPAVTRTTGIILVILGLGAYFGTGSRSFTALIPSFFGILIFISGMIAGKEKWRKHAMHAALGLALLGLLGSASGLPKVFELMSGGSVARPAAAITQSIMAVICLVYLVLGVRSFIAARRTSETQESNPDNS